MSMTPRFRILAIDDTPSLHADYRKVLCADAAAAAGDARLSNVEAELFGDAPAAAADAEPTFEIDSAHQGADGLALLKRAVAEGRPYAMAFVDMRMPPGWDGVRTIRELWKVDPDLQVAICTAFSDYSPDEIAKELRIAGRMLILRKPFDGLEIRQTASALCEKWETARHKSELAAMVEARTAEIQRAALHDALTGLPNRVLFTDRLNQLLAHGPRDGGDGVAVLFVDLDDFKTVNDSLGHEAGDALLSGIAARLQEATRASDSICRVGESTAAERPMAARLGGDEFAILLTGLHADADAARVAQRLLDGMAQPLAVGGHSIKRSLSIGITTSSRGYASAEAMLRDADTAMYQAKRAGRNRFAMFDEAMHAAAVRRLTLEQEMRDGLARGEFRPYYQPIVDIRADRLAGFEALARWQHPTRGIVAPDDFIPIAEETGLIVELGAHILRTACRQLAEWRRRDGADLTMSVNVSRRQLHSDDFVGVVKDVLAETGVPPEALKLEVTESLVMTDARASVATLEKVRELRVQLHVDDFGTGYSSLSCLQQLPLTGLKIDRSFVSELTTRPERKAILRAIVALANSLNLPIVSEGVETDEQSEVLRAMGCEFGQGFLFGKALDGTAASTFIDSWRDARAAA